MNEQMLNKVATDLNIHIEDGESEQSWIARVLYSLVGLQMLSSLYDSDDSELADSNGQDDGTVSMQHVLRRGNILAQIFELAEADTEKMRKLYISSGFMLHKNNRLAAPSLTTGGMENISLYRGLPPWKASNVSGSGIWAASKSVDSFENMFNIEKKNISDWLNAFLNRAHWRQTQALYGDVEFLNITEPALYGYWLQKTPVSGITVCRTVNVGERRYSLLQIAEDIKVYPLPDWLVTNGEYRRIAIALRSNANNAPTVTIKKRLYTAHITFDYLLPPSEQTFVELFSWGTEPNPFDIRGRLSRIISIELLSLYRVIFNRLGFVVQED